MKCPYCFSTETKVVDKRDNMDEALTRRRRECLKCKKRFTTYERIEVIDLTIIKRDGKLQQFSREKLKKGILKAFKEDEDLEELADSIVDEIEQKLLSRKSTQIKSSEIGKMVLTRLSKLDPLAYIRFASIYKDFNSIDELLKEIKSVKRTKH